MPVGSRGSGKNLTKSNQMSFDLGGGKRENARQKAAHRGRGLTFTAGGDGKKKRKTPGKIGNGMRTTERAYFRGKGGVDP